MSPATWEMLTNPAHRFLAHLRPPTEVTTEVVHCVGRAHARQRSSPTKLSSIRVTHQTSIELGSEQACYSLQMWHLPHKIAKSVNHSLRLPYSAVQQLKLSSETDALCRCWSASDTHISSSRDQFARLTNDIQNSTFPNLVVSSSNHVKRVRKL